MFTFELEKEFMNIAFFDSGIGGLTVLREAMQRMPNESYIYFADTDNVPYGLKTHEQITQYVFEAVNFLTAFDLKALVLACNTATSVVVRELRSQFDFPIIGMEPAVKPATELSSKKVLVCATERTLKEEKLDFLIYNLKATDRVEKCSLQSLVTYAENFDFNNPQIIEYLNTKFQKIDWAEFDAIVLGCTHFLYFKNIFSKILPDHVKILDGNAGTINRLVSLIDHDSTLEKNKEVQFFKSSRKVMPLYFDHYFRYLDEQVMF